MVSNIDAQCSRQQYIPGEGNIVLHVAYAIEVGRYVTCLRNKQTLAPVLLSLFPYD